MNATATQRRTARLDIDGRTAKPTAPQQQTVPVLVDGRLALGRVCERRDGTAIVLAWIGGAVGWTARTLRTGDVRLAQLGTLRPIPFRS